MTTIAPVRAARRVLAAATLSIAVLAGAACGTSSEPAPAAAPSGPSTAGFPKTVQGVFGAAQIPAPATRVVALGKNDAEAAITVGLVPVGVSSGLDVYPWLQSAITSAKSTVLADETGPPLEQIAGLAPDLILASDTVDPAEFSALNAIAPTVTRATDDRSAVSWQDFTRRVGDATGRTAQADTAIADTEGKQRELIARYPGIAGKTFSLSNLSADFPFVIYADDSPGVQFFTGLGMKRSPQFDGLANGSVKVGENDYLSLEQLNLLDADVVVTSFVTPQDKTFFEANRVFADMGASKRKAVVALDQGQIGQVLLPSALGNVPVLEQVLPQLDAAARTAAP